MESIYTQAVADAKAVRESAMANAKAAIQEAFEPKIKAMLKKHIVESEEDEMDEQEISGIEKPAHRLSTIKKATGFAKMKAPQGAIEDLEEYDEMDESKEEMNEGSFTFDYNDPEYVQTLLNKAGIKAIARTGTFDDEVEVSGDAKAIKQAKKILADDFDLGMDENLGAEYGSGPAEEEDPGNLDEKYLDEILDELSNMDEAEDQDESDEEDEIDEAYQMDEAEEEAEESEEEDEDGEEVSEEDTKVVDVTLGDLVNAIKAAMAGNDSGEDAEAGDDEVSLDEILAELEYEGEEDKMEEAKKKDKERIVKTGGAALKAAEKETAYKKELAEAKKAIDSMRAELNEINLLNAKLLYVNKIFKSKSLTESQKVKVLNAFDRATTVKEVKNTFKVITESITAEPKRQLKESYGFASKPTGGAPKGNTLESDPFIARMQKLAGL